MQVTKVTAPQREVVERWTSCQVFYRADGDSGDRFPFEDALFESGGDSIGKALRDMKLLEEGFPPSNRALEYAKADDKKPRVFILKAKPSCWRLYFWPDNKKKRLVYLHAKCKKKRKQNAKDSEKARERLEDLHAGRASLTVLEIPDR